MKPFTLSRTMRPWDYNGINMVEEVRMVREVQSWVVPPHPFQHTHRTWEQALAWKAVKAWADISKRPLNTDITVSDWGAGVGMFPAMLVSVGVCVDMFENWKPMYRMTTRAEGDESNFVHRQVSQILEHTPKQASGRYHLLSSPMLGELDETWWKKYDISLCISTLEHIANWEESFDQLCKTVKPGGLLFLTMDFADDGWQDGAYIGVECRSKMFNKFWMHWLAGLAKSLGFDWLGGEPDWAWSEDMRMVNNYGFASLVMVRNK